VYIVALAACSDAPARIVALAEFERLDDVAAVAQAIRALPALGLGPVGSDSAGG